MEEIIKKNLFVYTRDKYKDYNWVCKPSNLNAEDAGNLMGTMEETFFKTKKSGNFIGEWYHFKLKKDDYEIVFRIVIDGRTDSVGRLIRRYEGSIIPTITDHTISILERCLLEKQKETNNYNYGFRDSLQTEKNTSFTEKGQSENCTIEMKSDAIIIKSDILDRFLQEHTYEDLFALLQVESNNIEEKPKL